LGNRASCPVCPDLAGNRRPSLHFNCAWFLLPAHVPGTSHPARQTPRSQRTRPVGFESRHSGRGPALSRPVFLGRHRIYGFSASLTFLGQLKRPLAVFVFPDGETRGCKGPRQLGEIHEFYCALFIGHLLLRKVGCPVKRLCPSRHDISHHLRPSGRGSKRTERGNPGPKYCVLRDANFGIPTNFSILDGPKWGVR